MNTIIDKIVVGGRSKQVLKYLGVQTKTDALKAIEEDRIRPNMHQYGWESFCQLCCALGLSTNYRSPNYFRLVQNPILKNNEYCDYQI